MASSQVGNAAAKTLPYLLDVWLGIVEVVVGCTVLSALIYGIAVALCYDYTRRKFVRPPKVAGGLPLLAVWLSLGTTSGIYMSSAFGQDESPFWLCLLVALVGVFIVSLLLTGIWFIFAMGGSIVQKKLDLLFATTDETPRSRGNEAEYTSVPSGDMADMEGDETGEGAPRPSTSKSREQQTKFGIHPVQPA